MDKKLLAIVVCIFTLGCASSPPDLSNTEFLTKITASNLKHFEVRLKNRDFRETRLSRQQNNPRRSPPINPKRARRTLENVADVYIEQNNFCSTGYWIIETNIYGPSMRLRGECNEAAEEKDRVSFPDTISQW